MVSGTRTAHNIEIAAESLQEDLARLEIQKQALERELAAVVAHLGSVQRALSALEALMPGPAGTDTADMASAAGRRRTPAPVAPGAGVSPSTPADVAPVTGSQARRAGRRQGTEEPAASKPSADVGGQKKYGKLTEQILEYFASVGDAEVRARDVAAALGRDTDSGAINAVRSTLDRLVGTSRVRRTGRGLYRAKRP
ncbi:hypothetical protein [Streptomyces viridosporus]|uniref:hypothetical protein n=1 Tax=Streptomyces viridosporus TaxID=67581 RepID=UPI0009C05DEB|nr:hypothetical protein [Streptomyces viridosporus]